MKRQFTNWIKDIIRDYGFEEGVEVFNIRVKNPKGGRPRDDVQLTLDVAKEVAMIGNTPKGKATRRYFIAAEKAAVPLRFPSRSN